MQREQASPAARNVETLGVNPRRVHVLCCAFNDLAAERPDALFGAFGELDDPITNGFVE